MQTIEPMSRRPRPSDWERLGLRFEHLSPHLDRLERGAVDHVLRYFRAQSALLVRKRAELDRRARLTRGARAAVAALPPDPAGAYGRQRLRLADAAARDIEIMRLARRGWSNAMIGRRMGLHPTTVSKLIRRALALGRVR